MLEGSFQTFKLCRFFWRVVGAGTKRGGVLLNNAFCVLSVRGFSLFAAKSHPPGTKRRVGGAVSRASSGPMDGRACLAGQSTTLQEAQRPAHQRQQCALRGAPPAPVPAPPRCCRRPAGRWHLGGRYGFGVTARVVACVCPWTAVCVDAAPTVGGGKHRRAARRSADRAARRRRVPADAAWAVGRWGPPWPPARWPSCAPATCRRPPP